MTGPIDPVRLSIAKEFSRTPGPRKRSEGKHSGEEFLTLLSARFKTAVAKGSKLLVDLDGAAGYPTSFLEAAFGGLARSEGPGGPDLVLRTVEFKCDDEPDLIQEIKDYISEANA
jgi:hypothetical protein